jgi:hypothetical protein
VKISAKQAMIEKEEKKGKSQTYGVKIFLKLLDIETFSPCKDSLTSLIKAGKIRGLLL